MKYLYLSVLAVMLALSSSVSAQETEALLDLTDRTTFDNCTQTSLKYDHDSYSAWTFNNYGKYPYMYNYNITEPYYSDYLISPELTLKANTLYRIEMSPAAYNSSKTTSLTVGVGQGSDVSTYTVLGKFDNIPYASKANAEQKTVEFHVDADGQYKIYFLGETNGMYLYNTKVVEIGSSNVPAAVTDLAVMPASDGSASATVAFTLPSATISGHPLDGTVKYRIYRDGGETAVKAGRGDAGEYVTYTDNAAPTGNVTYAVEVEHDGNVSSRASVSTYVGKETPSPVAELKVSKAENTYSLSWTAPTKGVHGALIDPSALTYKISRIVDGEPTVIADACTATTYTDNYASTDLHSLQYAVVAMMNGESSEEAKSGTYNVGYVTLPFSDSFAGASFGKMWTAETISGRFNWTAVASTSTQKPIVAEAYDHDGGFAFYNSWSATRGSSARLATAPIKNIAGSAPIIEFHVFRTTGNDQIKIQVSCDDGEWTDVPDAVVTLKGTPLDWEKVSFPIGSAITEGCNTFRVALVAVSNYNQNTVIDKVRIFVPADKDLESASPIAPASVYSGNDIDLTFSINNNSAKAVSASDYSYELVTDYPTAVTLPATVDIPAFGSAEVKVKVPVSAIEAKAANAYSFALKVNYEGDENLANNTSAAAVVNVNFVEEAAPSHPSASRLADGSVEVKWNAAGVTHTPVNVGTSFEGYDNDYAGPFDGFTSLDLDEAAGENYYMASGSAFKVINKPSTPKGADGNNVIGLTLGANKQQNDWLISPALDCKEGATMNLSFLVATRKFTSSSYYYTMEILYSTDDEFDAANPLATFTHKVQTLTSSLTYGQFINSETFVPISITGIPAEAKRVAIHFISKIAYTSALWLDNVRITEANANPLMGYNVYEDGVRRVNTEVIAPEQTSFVVTDATDPNAQYFITAVYASGESLPTEPTGAIVSGITDLDANNGGVSVKATAEGIVVEGADQAAVFDLQGRIVAYAHSGSAVSLAPGVYVVKAGRLAYKVVVRK